MLDGVLMADVWQWIERTTWLVTIAGVVVAIGTLWLLLQEQRRIGRELGRRPRIKLGIVVPGRALVPKNLEMTYTILQGRLGDPRHQIGFGLANEGERTAFGLYHELIFPASVAEAISIDGRGFADGSGLIHLLWGPDDLHPRSGLTHYAFLVVRPNIARIAIQAIATYQDSPRVEAELEIVLQRIA
jgi:hypothetical protein